MINRLKVEMNEIESLWRYFLIETPSTVAKIEKGNTDAAVVSDEQRVLLRYPGEKKKTDKLGHIGGFLTGSAVEFSSMFEDDMVSLTFDTESGKNLYIIPFRTKSEDQRVVDTVVVIYGKDLSFMAYKFEELSKIGWKAIAETLVRD